MLNDFDSHGINLFQYWEIFKKRKKFFFGFVFITTFVMLIYVYQLPNLYKAQAVLLPTSNNNNSDLLSTIAQNVAFPNLGASQSGIQKVDALLHSSELTRQVIRANDLIPVLFEGKLSSLQLKSPNGDAQEMIMQMAVGKLLGLVDFVKGKKNGTLVISAEFQDPKLAARVVGSYLEELQKFLNKSYRIVAKRRYLYIERQIAENKNSFLRVSEELKNFSVSGKQNRHVYLSSFDDLQSSAMDEFFSNQLHDLKKQEMELNSEIGRFNLEGMPESMYLQYLVTRMGIMNELHFLLLQQYEAIKLQENKEQIEFQVIDPPRVPQFRSYPQKRQMLMVTFVASSFFAIFFIFLIEYIQKNKGQLSRME